MRASLPKRARWGRRRRRLRRRQRRQRRRRTTSPEEERRGSDEKRRPERSMRMGHDEPTHRPGDTSDNFSRSALGPHHPSFPLVRASAPLIAHALYRLLSRMLSPLLSRSLRSSFPPPILVDSPVCTPRRATCRRQLVRHLRTCGYMGVRMEIFSPTRRGVADFLLALLAKCFIFIPFFSLSLSLSLFLSLSLSLSLYPSLSILLSPILPSLSLSRDPLYWPPIVPNDRTFAVRKYERSCTINRPKYVERKNPNPLLVELVI